MMANLSNDYRYLPTNSSVPTHMAMHSYCILGENYSIKGIDNRNIQQEPNVKDEWAKAIYLACYFNRNYIIPYHLSLVYIDNIPLTQILEECTPDNDATRFLKAMMGEESYIGHNIFGCLIVPEDHFPLMWNDESIEGTRDLRTHLIAFKKDEGRGYANVQKDQILSLAINMCSQDTFNKIVAAISVYLQKRPLRFKGKSTHALNSSLYKCVKSAPNLAFDIDLLIFPDNIPDKITIMETEFKSPNTYKMTFRYNMTLASPKGLTWHPPNVIGNVSIPPDSQVPSGYLEDAFELIKALRRRIVYYSRNLNELLHNIKNKRFDDLNLKYCNYIRNKNMVSACCRTRCLSLVDQIDNIDKQEDFDNYLKMSLCYSLSCYYVFTNAAPVQNILTPLNSFIFAGYEVSMALNTGLIILADDNFTIGGVQISNEVRSISATHYYEGFLPGFRLQEYDPEIRARSKTIKEIIENKDSIKKKNSRNKEIKLKMFIANQ